MYCSLLYVNFFATNSRSEFVMSPVGFLNETSLFWIDIGKDALAVFCLETAVLFGFTTPPHANPKASWYFDKTESSGTISCIFVGLFSISLCKYRKSSSAACTPFERLLRCFESVRSANCIWLNNPRAPGSAAAMERSSPRTLCHFLADVLFCDGRIWSRISCRHTIRCSGSSRVSLIVSIIQPSTNFKEAHVQSPWSIFFSATVFTSSWKEIKFCIDQFLDYAATHPNAEIQYDASAMHLWIHSDASYLNETKARSQNSGFFYLLDEPKLSITNPIPWKVTH